MTIKTNNTLQSCIHSKDTQHYNSEDTLQNTFSIMALGVTTISKKTPRITILCRTILSVKIHRMMTGRMKQNSVYIQYNITQTLSITNIKITILDAK